MWLWGNCSITVLHLQGEKTSFNIKFYAALTCCNMYMKSMHIGAGAFKTRYRHAMRFAFWVKVKL